MEHMQHDKCKKMWTNCCILIDITSSVDSSNDLELLKGSIINMVKIELITGWFEFIKGLPNEASITSCLYYEDSFSLNDEAEKGPMTNSLDQSNFVIIPFPTLILSPYSSVDQEMHFNKKTKAVLIK